MHSPLNSERPFQPFVARHLRGMRWVYTAEEAVEPDGRLERLVRSARDLAYLLLATAGWLAVNLLTVLGCAVAAFLVLSAGNLKLFFSHLDNLTTRYVEADLGRQAAFELGLVQLFVGLLCVTILLRAPGFIRRTRAELRRPQGRAA